MGLFTLLNVAAGQVQPGDMSFIALFHQAHLVVKVVMIGLIFSSIWAWGIVFEKMFAFRRAKKLSDQFERQFWAGEPFKDLYARCLQNQPQAMSAVFVAAMREWERSQETGAKASEALKMRLAKVMDLAVVRETDKLERRLLFLATIGSTAPFIGLFGTVWGIMTSFQAIAASKNTSLAVVAPGIAEALFATALGLLAAIPAVIFYNKFSSDLGRVGQRLEGFADEFSTILSRQMEASK